MLKSMTAFGRSNVATPVGRFIVEIQSVNRKYLEVSTSLPKELTRFESDFRKWVGMICGRGQVYVRLNAIYEEKGPFTVTANLKLAEQYQSACNTLAKALGLETVSDIKVLIEQPGVLVIEDELIDENIFRDALKNAFDAAAQHFCLMKEVEGMALEKDIKTRLKILDQKMSEIEIKASDAPDKYREKLTERLSEFTSSSPETNEVILREVVVFASRVDVTEEIVRFKSHLAQFNTLLEKKIESPGKTFDFLLQELNREANTIASKSVEAVISQKVVEIKCELEKIREQVQNIE